MSEKEKIKAFLLKEKEDGKKPYCIVHVDDEGDILEIAKDHFQEYGFQVLSFLNGETALKEISVRAHEIVLILSDIKMPKMDGFAFRESVYKIAPQIPFAILSAHVDKELALRGLETKISGFLSKPIVPSELEAILSKESLPRITTLNEDRELRDGFVSDCESLIEESEELLLRLENNCNDDEALNRLFAVIHTIKGGSGFFDPKYLNQFSHRFEEILKGLQKKEIQWNENVSKTLFRGFDIIKELFLEFKETRFVVREMEDLFQQIDLKNAQEVGTASTAVENNKSVAGPTQPKEEKAKTEEEIKVSVSLLDEFMQLSGEVTVIRNMLNKCVTAIEKRYSGDRDIATLSELLSELHKINSSVQSKVTEIRKVPVKSITKVLPRAIRDVSKKLNKEAELVIHGEDLRVDTSLAEVLNNSLLHIVKNSLDHGIEMPAERTAQGKSSKGKIDLRFMGRDEKICVEISDDGKGLHVQAIRNKLMKNGTHTAEQLDRMTREQIYAMIFSSGFSTAAQVTDISGRGVGMSMVKDSVDAIGGEIQIESEEGKGSKFRLILPIPKSVLISNCLSIRCKGVTLGIVRDDILKVLEIGNLNSNDIIQSLEKAKTLTFEGELIPLVDLNSALSTENILDKNRNAFNL